MGTDINSQPSNTKIRKQKTSEQADWVRNFESTGVTGNIGQWTCMVTSPPPTRSPLLDLIIWYPVRSMWVSVTEPLNQVFVRKTREQEGFANKNSFQTGNLFMELFQFIRSRYKLSVSRRYSWTYKLKCQAKYLQYYQFDRPQWCLNNWAQHLVHMQ